MALGLLATLVGLGVLLGAATQRITGLGFALVSAPIMVLLLGVSQGVPLVQFLGILTSFMVFLTTFKDVAWKKVIALVIPATLGILPGRWLVHAAPEAILLVVVGSLVVIAILAMLADERSHIFRGTPGLLSAGFLAGFMNVVAGVSGPIMVLYKLSTNWRHQEYVATLQVFFMALSTGALIALGWPRLDLAIWVAALLGMAIGIVIGHHLGKRVPTKAAGRLVVAVALAGALATVAQGVARLLG